MFHAWILGKPSLAAAAPLLLSLIALPSAAQQPAPAPPDLTWHGAAAGEAPPPLPLAPRDRRLCEDALCRARLVGELWKKGGVALDVTPLRW